MRNIRLAQEIARDAADLALRERGFGQFDEFAVPTYITDADGVLTYFNQASVKFSGRTPALKQDQWCVTWRLYTLDGAPLPHNECPMAIALRQRRAVRGEVAIAERPDGSRSAFMPFPTPLFDEGGKLWGAVNVFLDPTDGVTFLTNEARKYRRLAALVDAGTADTVRGLASEYERKAQRLLDCSEYREVEGEG